MDLPLRLKLPQHLNPVTLIQIEAQHVASDQLPTFTLDIQCRLRVSHLDSAFQIADGDGQGNGVR